jgi:3-oxoadipate enol-lactonase
MARHHDEASTPPPDLPLGLLTTVPGRGEMFLRRQDGPAGAAPVLLLHGWTASADTTWWPVYPALQGHHPLVAVDHRGHGRGIRAELPFSLEACADDAAALLELLETGPAVVAGYSMGGAVALLLAQRHPHLVAGLVLAATAAEWRSTPRERTVWRAMTAFDLALRLGTGDGFVQRYLRLAVEDTPDVADLRAWVGGEFKRGYPRDLARAGRALSEFDARPFAPALGVPMAVVVTTRDRLVRPSKQRELARLVAAETFELDADHDAPFVRSKEFAHVMVDAVAAVAPE